LFKLYSPKQDESEWLTPDKVDFIFSHVEDDEIQTRIRDEAVEAEISQEQDIVDARDSYYDSRLRFFEKLSKEPIKKMLIEARVKGSFRSLLINPLRMFAAKSNLKIQGFSDVPFAGRVLKYFNEDGSRKCITRRSKVKRKGQRFGDIWVDDAASDGEIENHDGDDNLFSKAFDQAPENPPADSSITLGLRGANTATLMQEGADSMPTAMDAEIQGKPPGYVQQDAASESSNQALEDAAGDPAAEADSSSTSSSAGAATTAVTKDVDDSMLTVMDAISQGKTPGKIQQDLACGSSHESLVDSASNSCSIGATSMAATLSDIDSLSQTEILGTSHSTDATTATLTQEGVDVDGQQCSKSGEGILLGEHQDIRLKGSYDEPKQFNQEDEGTRHWATCFFATFVFSLFSLRIICDD